MRVKLNSVVILVLAAAVAGPVPGAAGGNRTSRDIDGDGIANRRDRDIDGDRIPNGRDRNTDGDRFHNRRDRETDSDGITNWRDRDVDADRVSNSRDKDVDGDGAPNRRDRDVDGDRSSNNLDPDIDGDGILNFEDDDSDSSGSVVSGGLPVGLRLPPQFFGLVADDVLAAKAGADRREVLGTIGLTGVRTLRQTFDWAAIERSRGAYDFSAYDRFVADTTRAGYRILPILFNPPSFRSREPGADRRDGIHPPKSNTEFAAFATALVRRYGPGGAFWELNPSVPKRPLRSWQVWNEPNTEHYWPPAPAPEEYAAMLKTVGAAIKRADPGAEVVTAGLPESPIGMPINRFLTAMYRAGARRTFDALAIHPYARATDAIHDIVARARLVLDRHGDGDIELRITELGWATGGPADQPLYIGERGQAALIRRVLASLAREHERWGLRSIVYYNWRDHRPAAGEPDFWGLHTGLLGIDGRPKPGHWAFAETVKALTGP
jgi:hypothetical protein